MTNIDQFESVFKAADKPVFHPHDVSLPRRVVVCDAVGGAAEEFAQRCKKFLTDDEDAHWDVISGDQFGQLGELLTKLAELDPHFVVTHRNLHVSAAEHPFSLGTYLDVLTQATPYPVLVVPNVGRANDRPIRHVMAISDQLVGEDRLVSFAARLTAKGGTLILAHVEDEIIFNRYMDAIAKIPAIDTDPAKELILERLLEDPLNFIESCRETLIAGGFEGEVRALVQTGHRIGICTKLVEEDDVDVLVLNTKDDEQLAMHGLAYPLAVELRDTPLLLL
ncbi:MAG TPA: hypothetical protein EYG57_17630 [Planctomycetes bacterium]|nr:hypothetical protein [Planctomycetaceae bacterium]HIM31352.1 hypothetical protein [Planctomycetota bacterium]